LDEERHWYRYHHLFADMLRQRLHQGTAISLMDDERSVAELHKLASAWYEDNGLDTDAFAHAVAANDIERAARLAEGEGMPLHLRGGLSPVLNWLELLPTSVLDARPSLWVMYGSALLLAGKLTSVEAKLQAAEAALQGVEQNDKTRNLLGYIAAGRATLAAIMIAGQQVGAQQKLQDVEGALQITESDDKTEGLMGQITPMQAGSGISQQQVDNIITQSRRALEYLDPDNLHVRTAANWILGIAYQLKGDRAAAIRAYTETITIDQASGGSSVTISATIGLGNLQEAGSQLYLAAESYRRGLHMVGDPPLLPVACEAYLGLARICYEWNDLEAAQQHGQQSVQLARQLKDNDRFIACELFLTRLKVAQGDVIGAATTLAETEQFMRQHNFVHRMPEAAAVQVSTLIHQGNLPPASDLVEKYELPLSQARVHLAQGDASSALALLEPFRQHAATKGWVDERLKAAVLQAVAYHVHGEKKEAV
jgi:LuxR family maltose regulon positive regulatory protein